MFAAAKIGEAAQSLWYRSADAWSDHRANARFAEGAQPLWLSFYAADANRDDIMADPTGLATGDALLDYSQDFFGIQGGLDFAGDGPITFGLTTGYLSSRVKLRDGGVGADFDVVNVGAYAAWQRGGAYIDTLVKYDFISGNLRDPMQGGFTGDADGEAYGGHLKLGYRSGGGGLLFEPYARLEYQQTDLDPLAINGQQFLFDNIDGLRGTAGLRIGMEGTRSNATTIGYYLDASAVNEFEGKGRTSFVSGPDTVSFRNNAIDTYAHIEAGLTLGGKGPLSGYFQVEGDASGDYTSVGGHLGIRFGF